MRMVADCDFSQYTEWLEYKFQYISVSLTVGMLYGFSSDNSGRDSNVSLRSDFSHHTTQRHVFIFRTAAIPALYHPWPQTSRGRVRGGRWWRRAFSICMIRIVRLSMRLLLFQPHLFLRTVGFSALILKQKILHTSKARIHRASLGISTKYFSLRRKQYLFDPMVIDNVLLYFFVINVFVSVVLLQLDRINFHIRHTIPLE